MTRRTVQLLEEEIDHLNRVAALHGDPYRYKRGGAFGGHQLVAVGTVGPDGSEIGITRFTSVGECYEAVKYYAKGACSNGLTPAEWDLIRAHRELSK